MRGSLHKTSRNKSSPTTRSPRWWEPLYAAIFTSNSGSQPLRFYWALYKDGESINYIWIMRT